MSIVTGISIGILVGFATSLDFIYVKKRTSSGFIFRSLIYSSLASIPKLITLLSQSNKNISLIADFIIPSFTVSLFLSLIVTYIYYRRIKKNYKNTIFTDEVISFAELFYNGYEGLKESIKEAKKNDTIRNNELDKSLIMNSSFYEELPEFIIKIFTEASTTISPLDYCVEVLKEFVNQYLSKSEARFTIRKYNSETRKMESFKTTAQNDHIPSPIPIDKINMISKSLEFDMPLIYSEHPEYHYDTHHNTQNKIWIDYVSYCLVKDNSGEIPLFSICLDVKSPDVKKKMIAIVKTSYFKLICDIIKFRLKQYAQEVGLL